MNSSGDTVNPKKFLSGHLGLASVFRKLVAKGADADLEEFSGLGAVAIGALEGFENGTLLEFVERHDIGTHDRCNGIQWSRDGWRRHCGRWRGEPHEFCADRHSLLSEDGSAFDDILEFAHIAGPAMSE